MDDVAKHHYERGCREQGRQIKHEAEKFVAANFFENEIGFLRVSSKPKANIDLDVGRHYMRFSGIFDTTKSKIYRR